MEDENLTVSQVNSYISKKMNRDAKLKNIYVKGELSNYKSYQHGHDYFTLKDEKSQIKGVMFKGRKRFLEFTPKDGIKVVIKGSVKVYEKNGYYQLKANSMVVDGVGPYHIAFEKLKKKAFENSDYNEDGTEKTFFQKASWSELLTLFGVAFCCIFFSIILPIYKLFRYWFGYLYDKKLLGLSKITEWYRAAPLENNLFAAYYVLRKGSPYTSSKATQNIVGAFFLKWILEGIIHAVPEGKKGINLVFGEHLPENTNQMSVQELELYSMAREACGDNLILEKNEFKKWSRKKYTKVTKWPDNAYAEGKSFLMSKGFLDNKGKGTETGKEEMRHVIELKNFLKDFTKIDERTAMETILWKEYLIYAQLFGIADKVSQQMAKLFPAEMEQFTQSIGTDHTTFMRALTYNSSMTSSAVLNALSKASGGSSWSSGGGGRSSYGGGGGFSGGGHGGGSR